MTATGSRPSNPYASLPEARAHSCYTSFVDGRLVTPEGAEPPRMAVEVHAALRALLHDPDFPCVGAKSVVNQASYRFGLYGEIAGGPSTAGLAYDLSQFVAERPSIEGDFTSFIATFVEPKVTTPKEYEVLLWRQLAALHRLDREHYNWSPAVSADTQDARFAFSFGGHAFFVVGLGPSSRRWARRFPWPTLVFNDHSQFDRLRAEQRYDRLREVIRGRDERLHGAPNEMLADFGAHSEARQYAGRRVGPSWRCPVHFDGGSDS